MSTIHDPDDEYYDPKIYREYIRLYDLSLQIHPIISEVQRAVEYLLENNAENLESALHWGEKAIITLRLGLQKQKKINDAIKNKIDEIRGTDDVEKRESLLASRQAYVVEMA